MFSWQQKAGHMSTHAPRIKKLRNYRLWYDIYSFAHGTTLSM